MSHPSQGKINPLMIVLVVVVLLLLGLGLWMIASSSNNQQQIDNNQQANTTESTSQDSSADTTKDWLLYNATGYSIRLADGWEIMKKQGSDASLVALDNEDLRPQPGQRAVVREYSPNAPSDFTYGLAIDHLTAQDSCAALDGFDAESFRTSDDLAIYKNVSAGVNESGLKAGDKRYSYCVDLNNSVIFATYTVAMGNASYQDTLEQVLRSITVD